jgi:hypothetical protein
MGRKPFDNIDPSMSDDLFDEMTDLLDEEQDQMYRDLADEETFDTQHSDGHTWNPQQAWEQGLTYTPPDDPPILPSDGYEDAEIAAGFSTTMEDSIPDDEDDASGEPIPDAELEERVATALRNNAETMDLTNITVRVRDGVAILLGTVLTDLDEGFVADIVADIPGIEDVESRLDLES